MNDPEIESGEECENAKNRIFDHFAKRAANYISGIIITAMMTATTTIISGHKADEVKSEVKADTSYLGTNWVGKNLLDEHNFSWESRAMILDLRSNLAVLKQELDNQQKTKQNHEN